ncbi:hypothetical protein ACVWZ9_005522 [Pseudomonas chlororaphis]|jgi:hypothetical protein
MQGRNICIEVEVLEGGRTDGVVSSIYVSVAVAVIQTDRHLLILMFRDEQIRRGLPLRIKRSINQPIKLRS